MKVEYYNDFHLGDCLLQLLMMSRLEQKLSGRPHELVFYCQREYHGQLAEAVSHTKIRILPLDQKTTGAVNSWIGCGDLWRSHYGNYNSDHLRFLFDWFGQLAGAYGLENPFSGPDDLVFDFPSVLSRTPLSGKSYDFLVVNSRPLSGQLRYGKAEADEMDRLIFDLSKKHSVLVTNKTSVKVDCTSDHGMSISGIGNASINCKNHIVVSTGPSWLTFNKWASPANRIIILDQTRLLYTPRDMHADTVQGVRPILHRLGIF